MSKTQVSKKTNNVRGFIESQMVETQELKYKIGETDELIVKVMPILPFTQRAEMVRTIASLVFINDGKTIDDYMPEYIELSKRLNVISYFTDFKMPKDINDVWLVLNYTTLFDDVVKIVGTDVYNIFAEADELIKARKHYLENKTDLNMLFAKLTNKLDEFGTQFNENNIQTIMKMLEKMPNLSSENIVKAIANIEKETEGNIEN